VCKCNEVERRGGHGKMRVHQFMTLRTSILLLFRVQYTYFLLILIYLIVVVFEFVVIIIVFALYSLYSVLYCLRSVVCCVFV
jgi:hypothetical protein